MIDQSPHPNETEADTRADRIDPALTALGWTGPDRIETRWINNRKNLGSKQRL